MRRHAGAPDSAGGESRYHRTELPAGATAPAHRVKADQVRVRDVMSYDLVVLPAWLAVSALADRTTRPRHAVYPVVDAAGVLVGVVDLAEIGGDPSTDDRLVAEVCTPVSMLAVVSPDDNVAVPIPRLLRRRNLLALVTENARLVGVVSSGSLLRFERGLDMAVSYSSAPGPPVRQPLAGCR